MQYVVRLGSEQARQQYPLEVSEVARWEQISSNQWQWCFDLPNVPKDHIIVPSFANLDEDYRYQFSALQASTYSLHPVPARSTDTPAKNQTENSAKLSCHIDCWHTESDILGGRIYLQVMAPQMPSRYLLCLSVRPLEIDVDASIKLPIQRTLQAVRPQPISQMQADQKVARSICSPTALTMALDKKSPASNWQATIDACHDPLTNAYGSWPLAIRWAAQVGVLGAVEVADSWQAACHALQQGTTVVCSIRFRKDQLSQAPLAQTAGHLVLLYGIDRDEVLVCDPAAATHDEVPRRYDLGEFTHAWLHRRGAAYYFCKH